MKRVPWQNLFRCFHSKRPTRRPSVRLAVGCLEDRLAPATFVVTLTTDTGATNSLVTPLGPGTAGDLRNAIFQAEQTPGTANVIDLTGVTGTITLSAMLPPLFTTGAGTLTINGPGAGNLTISGNNLFRPFFIAQGTVSINNLTLADGKALGGSGSSGGGGGAGMGGALLIDGTNAATAVTISNVVFTGNQAIGGAGGSGGSSTHGGGGGGLGGNGGSTSNSGSGGGGGFLGNGGSLHGGGGGFTGAGGGLLTNGSSIGGGGGEASFGTTGSTGGGNGDNQGAGGGGINVPGFPFASNGQNGQSGALGGAGGAGGFGGGGGSGGTGVGGAGGAYGGGGGASFGAAGGNGGFGGGGGAGTFADAKNGTPGGAGGLGGFGGGGGAGNGIALGANGGGNGDSAGHGGGGAGMGGAVFLRAGTLNLTNTTFTSNTATGGASGGGSATPGTGDGGAIFINAGATAFGSPTFSGNTATTNNNISGTLSPPPPKTTSWTGAVSNLWSVAGNWNNGAPASGDTLIFSTATTGFANNAAAFAPNNDLSGLTLAFITIFDSSAVGDFTISGNGFSLAPNAIINSNVTTGASATIDLGSNSISLNTNDTISSSSTAPLIINNPIDNGGNILNNNGVGTVILNGVISGAGGLSQLGVGGTLTLGNSANTYTGATNSTGGTINVAALANGGQPSSIGASSNGAGSLNLGAGFAPSAVPVILRYIGSTPQSTDRLLTLRQSNVTIDASGSVPGATVSFTNPGSIAISGSTLRTLTFTGTNTGANVFAPLLSGNRNVAKTGSGTWNLTNPASTYAGTTTVSGGILDVAQLANGGSASSIGQSTNAAANLVLDGGTLQYTGGTAQSTDRLFTVTANGGTLDASGSGAATVTFTNPGASVGPATAATLTLTGSNAGPNILTPILANGAGTLSVTKTGSGGWQLAGADTYTGATTVNAGLFAVTGSLNSSTVTVVGGTLGGNGAVANMVATGGIVSPSLNGLAPPVTLTTTGPTTSTFNGATFTAAINGASADRLSNSAGQVNLTGATLNVNTIAAGAIGTVYTIINSPGGVSGTFGNAANGATVNFGGTFYTVNYTATTVTLTRAAPSLHWTGAVSSSWNVAGNWLENTVPVSGATLSFDTTTAGFAATAAAFAPNNDLSGLTGLRITINDASAAGDFTISGNGFSVTGATAVTSTVSTGINATVNLGSNSLSLMSGSTIRSFSAAPLIIDNPINNNGFTLTNAGVGTAIINGVISGAGGLTQQDVGTLTLGNSANTYTGITTLAGGVVNVAALADGGQPSSIGASSNAAANLRLAPAFSPALVSLTLRYTGSTAQSTDRLFTLGNDNVTIDASGSVPGATVSFTNSGSVAIAGTTFRTLTFTGTNTGNNVFAPLLIGNRNVVKSGGGTWNLTNPASTYAGTTTLSGGVLNVAALANGGLPSSIGQSTNAATNLIFNGGTLQYTGSTAQSTDRLFTVTANGGALDASGSAAAATVTFTNPGASVGPASAATLTLTGSNAGTNTLASALADGGGTLSVAKAGSGLWQLAGVDTYSGGTFVTAGTLAVNGSVNSGATTVSGGTLTGTGSVQSVTVGGGTINPGNVGGPGTLGTGTVMFQAPSTFAVEINGTAASSYDQLSVTGNVNLSGATLAVSGSHTPAPGQGFAILGYTGTRTGTLVGLPEGATVTLNGVALTVHYDDTAKQVVLNAPTGPAVQSIQIDDGNMQRSMVRSLKLTFSSPLTPANLASVMAELTLTRVGGGAVGLTGTLDGSGTILTLRFTGSSIIGGSLADGRYTLSLAGTQVLGPSQLYRLFGDVTGDGKVDAADQAEFDRAMNTRKGVSAKYNQYLDYASDSVIINSDQTEFGKRKGKRLDANGFVVPI